MWLSIILMICGCSLKREVKNKAKYLDKHKVLGKKRLDTNPKMWEDHSGPRKNIKPSMLGVIKYELERNSSM